MPKNPEVDSPDVRARLDEALRLVPLVAESLRALFNMRVSLDDLSSYGNEGALVAARGFNPDEGTSFAHWARMKIRGAILDGLRASSTLSRRMHERLRAIEAAAAAHEGALLDSPRSTPASSATADALLSDRLAAMATAYAAGTLLCRDQGTLEAIEDPGATPEEELARAELKAAVRAAIAERPEHERLLLERYYYEGASLAVAAGGLSRGWASRLHAHAIEGVLRSLRRAKVVR
jgi:RNA polymerase sigma factor for flagellar operon FliA